MLGAERLERAALPRIFHPGAQCGEVLVVLAASRRARRHERALHRQESDRAPLVASRSDQRDRRRQRGHPAAQHFGAKFAGAHEKERTAEAGEAALLLAGVEALSGVRDLSRDHAGEQAQAFGGGLAVAEQAVDGRGKGVVGHRDCVQGSLLGRAVRVDSG